MSTQRHGCWWTTADGQFGPGEEYYDGFIEKLDAEKSAEDARANGIKVIGVKLLQTIESDQEKGTPGRQTFLSSRWCVIIKDDGLRSEAEKLIPDPN